MSIANLIFVDGSMTLYKDGIKPTLFDDESRIYVNSHDKKLKTVSYCFFSEKERTSIYLHSCNLSSENANGIILIIPNTLHVTVQGAIYSGRDSIDRGAVNSSNYSVAVASKGDIISIYSIETKHTAKFNVILKNGKLDMKEIPSI